MGKTDHTSADACLKNLPRPGSATRLSSAGSLMPAAGALRSNPAVKHVQRPAGPRSCGCCCRTRAPSTGPRRQAGGPGGPGYPGRKNLDLRVHRRLRQLGPRIPSRLPRGRARAGRGRTWRGAPVLNSAQLPSGPEPEPGPELISPPKPRSRARANAGRDATASDRQRGAGVVESSRPEDHPQAAVG